MECVAICLFIALVPVYFLICLYKIENMPRERAIKNKKTYFISRAGSTLNYMPKITCLKCNKTSYHPKDVQNKYCGYCHEFHKD